MFTGTLVAGEIDALIEETDKLILDQQYGTAFKLLNQFENSNIDVVLKKVELALNYFAISTHHEIFAFRNLAPGERLEDVRGQEGVYDYYVFQIEQALKELISKYPEEWRLHKALGEYFYEVFLKYGGRIERSEEELLDEAYKYYQTAFTHDLFDFKSLYFLGFYELRNEQNEEAIEYFLQALAIGDESHGLYPSANYNLAYAYLQEDKVEEALNYALAAYEYYEDPFYKADAGKLGGLLYARLGEAENAISYYNLSIELNPRDFYTLYYLLELYLEKKSIESANMTAEKIFLLEPENPSLPREILYAYLDYDCVAELIVLFTGWEKDFVADDLIYGNILFYKSQCYYFLSDLDGANNALTRAEESFVCYYPADHEVFTVIEILRESYESQPPLP